MWQRASNLSIDLYNAFARIKDYSFRDQIQRAGLSVPNNIAEGYARRSDKALRNFLMIAKGSAVEVESMVSIATRLNYISTEEQEKLTVQSQEMQKLLSGFIKKL